MRKFTLSLAFVTLILAACGGGSGDVGGDAADAPLGSAPANVQNFAAQINAARAVARHCGGVQDPAAPALVEWNSSLQVSAQAHADDMNQHKYFAHIGRDGSDPDIRASRAGYTGMSVGENLANGTTDAAELVALWLASPGHCTALMGQQYRTLAVGQSGTYTVLVLGQ